jgi:hypothetical protein
VGERRSLAEQRRERGQQRGRDDERARATVAQHVLVVRGREQRVRGDRHDAGLDRAEERRREVDRVVQRDEHALLRPHAEREQRRAEAVDAARELAVGRRAAIVDERGLAARPAATLRSIRSCAALYARGMSMRGGAVPKSADDRPGIGRVRAAVIGHAL